MLTQSRLGFGRIHRALLSAALLCWVGSIVGRDAAGQDKSVPLDWTIFITNDTCPDYTWGLTEEQTQQAFADLIRAHLDLMTKTDREAAENQDRYNMAVTEEALCFFERYPSRKEELIRRIKEKRAFLSPFLCNSLWGFHSVEGALRTLYPARRLEQQWGVHIDVAHHIEEPSLPWGMASILAGCGIRWLAVPFYNYDSTFADLKNPPLFVYAGPDGGSIRVILDSWVSNKASYAQGSYLLNKPSLILDEWIPHYRSLGRDYPARQILASGTHSDISLQSGEQALGFANAILKYNRAAEPHPKLFNAILPQFCQAIDEVQKRTPFLPVVRGCFGHSWDVWPVSLAKYAADMRQGERAFLAAEALIAMASRVHPELTQNTRHDREQAEWYWAMLSDHAWNGTDDTNRNVNAELRRKWSEELLRISSHLTQETFNRLGIEPDSRELVLFNSLSAARAGLVRIQVPSGIGAVSDGENELTSQLIEEQAGRFLSFVSPKIPAYEFKQLILRPAARLPASPPLFRATLQELESPYYRLRVNPKTGAVSSLVFKASGAELVQSHERGVCQSIYFDGREHIMEDVKTEPIVSGPVLARLKISGRIEGMVISTLVTVYADLDRVDFEVAVKKPVTTNEERLCQVFPVMRDGAIMRIETPGAVIRPQRQPEGDLLPGADPHRFAVQGFVDVSSEKGVGVTIVPLDAFALRRDLAPVTFEALGNDQNYKEVVKSQHGITDFRFRYVLQAHTGGYQANRAFAFSREVATGLLMISGRWKEPPNGLPSVTVNPERAIATCLKPAEASEPGACLLRLWEVGGKTGTLQIQAHGFTRAIETDLLERDLQPLKITNGQLVVEMRAHGLAAVRLLP
jgi:hypothetical protein